MAYPTPVPTPTAKKNFSVSTQGAVNVPSGAIGPSAPGYVQGTANRVIDPNALYLNSSGGLAFNPAKNTNPNQTTAYSNVLGASDSGGDSRLNQLSKTSRNPAEESEYQNLLASLNQGNEDMNNLINEAYGASSSYLDQAESALRSDYPNILSEIDAQKALSLRTADLGKQSTLGTIQEQQTTAEQRNQNVLADARRLYDELNRGYMQRFGGASSAGQAATELSRLEQQRQQGRTQQEFGNTMRQIETARTQVEQKYQEQVYQLDQQTNQAKVDAQRDFQNKLLQISQMRAENETNKAQARLQALQDLRNKIYQIDLQNLQFQQTLAAQKSQADQSLSSYGTQLSGYSDTSNQALTGYSPSVSSTLNVNDAFNSGGLTLDSQLYGMRTSRDEDNLVGSIRPSRRQFV